MLLSLKKCPLIRYQHSSDMAKRLAENIRVSISVNAHVWESIVMAFHTVVNLQNEEHTYCKLT